MSTVDSTVLVLLVSDKAKRGERTLVITRYKVKGPPMKITVVADLHGKYNIELIEALKAEKPDVILCPGDLATVGEYHDRLIDPKQCEKRLKTQDGALEFLEAAVNIAPVYSSRGNHEWGVDDAYREAVKRTGAVLLENEWVQFGEAWIGGLTSAKRYGLEEVSEKAPMPDTEWLKDGPDGFRILLNHHPEYYPLIESYADLILAGHSHGGQIRLFGHGLFAPGQGVLPKYSKGRYGNMIVSAGLANTTWIPRLFNPTELVVVEMSEEAI